MFNRLLNINKTFKNSINFIKQTLYKNVHIYQINNHLLDFGRNFYDKI